jgi:hypothetical protein
MVSAYRACASCARYVKRDERACPFCGCAARLASGSPSTTARVSRGQWLALGALVAVGCDGPGGAKTAADVDSSTEAGAADAFVPLEATLADAAPSYETGATEGGEEAEAAPSAETGSGDADSGNDADVENTPPTDGPADGDALADAETPEDAAAACPTRSGTFICGDPSLSVTCNRATEYCLLSGSVGRCAANALASTCGLCPTCDCLPIVYGGSCEEDDAGAVVSRGACYGSPPARLS